MSSTRTARKPRTTRTLTEDFVGSPFRVAYDRAERAYVVVEAENVEGLHCGYYGDSPVGYQAAYRAAADLNTDAAERARQLAIDLADEQAARDAEEVLAVEGAARRFSVQDADYNAQTAEAIGDARSAAFWRKVAARAYEIQVVALTPDELRAERARLVRACIDPASFAFAVINARLAAV